MNDVMPAIKTNQDGLKKVLDDLVKQYKTKQEDLDKWKVCLDQYNPPYMAARLTNSTEEEQCAGSPAMINDDTLL